jgi:hypothetical protein
VSYVEDLLNAYGKFVSLPWQQGLAPAQRVWMAVYPPEQERRIRLHLPAFKAATIEYEHPWGFIDITTSFETWMAVHRYRDAYFTDPDLLETALPAFFDHLAAHVRSQLEGHAAPDGVVGLLGAGAMFGLAGLKVSALLNAVNDAISGRLLVFFPGQVENNNFRLLEARDGWDYMAVVITPDGRGR